MASTKFVKDPHNPDTHEYLIHNDEVIGERWFGYPGATGLRYFLESEVVHRDQFLGELGDSAAKVHADHLYRIEKAKRKERRDEDRFLGY